MTQLAQPLSEEEKPIWLDTKEAAALLHISPVTLAEWRAEGVGPTYFKFSRRAVRYRRSDLIAWINGNARVTALS